MLRATDVFDWDYERIPSDSELPAAGRDVTHVEEEDGGYRVFTRGEDGFLCHGMCMRTLIASEDKSYKVCHHCHSVEFFVPEEASYVLQ